MEHNATQTETVCRPTEDPITDTLIGWYRAIRKDPFAIRDVPEDILTEEFCEFAVRHCSLKHIPLRFRTKRICTVAVTAWLDALEFVPDGLFSPDEIMALIKPHINGFGKCHVDKIPERFMIPEVCSFLVDEAMFLSHIPAHLLTETMLLERKRRYFKNEFGHILETRPTDDFLCRLLARHGEILEFLPEKFKTRELCSKAVANYGPAIRFVPLRFIDQQLSLLAAQYQEDGFESVLESIPDEFRTYQVCLLCVGRAGHELKHVPKRHLDGKICLAAVMADGCAIEDIPPDMLTKEMCMAALTEKFSPWDACHVPDAFLEDREMALAYVRKNAMLLSHVPQRHLDSELYLAASQGALARIDLIPDEMLTWEMCANIIREDTWQFDAVPERFRDEALAKEARFQPAFSKDEFGGLWDVPEDLLTEDVCLAHVEYCALAIRHVPVELRTRKMWLAAAKSYVENSRFRQYINWIGLTNDCGLMEPIADCRGRIIVSRQEFAEMPEAMRELCVVRD